MRKNYYSGKIILLKEKLNQYKIPAKIIFIITGIVGECTKRGKIKSNSVITVIDKFIVSNRDLSGIKQP